MFCTQFACGMLAMSAYPPTCRHAEHACHQAGACSIGHTHTWNVACCARALVLGYAAGRQAMLSRPSARWHKGGLGGGLDNIGTT